MLHMETSALEISHSRKPARFYYCILRLVKTYSFSVYSVSLFENFYRRLKLREMETFQNRLSTNDTMRIINALIT